MRMNTPELPLAFDILNARRIFALAIFSGVYQIMPFAPPVRSIPSSTPKPVVPGADARNCHPVISFPLKSWRGSAFRVAASAASTSR